MSLNEHGFSGARTMPVLNLKFQNPAGAIIPASDLPQWINGNAYLEAAKQAVEDLRQEIPRVVAEESVRAYNEGLDAATKDATELLTRIKATADAYYLRLSQEVTDLVIKVAGQIIGQIQPSEVVYATVVKALETLDLRTEFTLYVAPQVFDEVRDKLTAYLDSATQSKLLLKQDPKLLPSASRLVSDFGTVDLSIERQLEILAGSLRSAGIGVQS